MGERVVSDINHTVIVGRVGQDPDFKETKGADLCRLSVATSRTWRDKEGERHTDTTWHNVTCWGRTAGIARDFVNKGDRIGIVGRHQQNRWTTDKGEKRISYEIYCTELMLIGGTRPQGERKSSPRREPTPEEVARPHVAIADGDFNDDIPW